MRLPLAPLLLLSLTACGDSLEDRNAALNHEQFQGIDAQEMVRDTRASDPANVASRNASATPELGEPTPEDGDGAAAVLDTRGFSADPADDAQGMAPEPIAPESYVPEVYVPETFTPERFDD
jgi:hypothetical protein